MLLAALLLAWLSLWSAQDAWGVTAQKVDEDPAGNPYVSGELIVVYESGVETKAAQSLPEEVEGEVEEELPAVDAQVLAFPEVKREDSEGERERALRQEKAALENDPAVESVSLNYIYRASYTPNDPRFADQYGLEKIRAPEAWDRVKGNDVDIAVVDSGIDTSHPDLASKISNQRNFVGPTQSPSAEDDEGHGTAVSGVAAAVTNNGQGVAGACPECRIMAAKVIGSNGSGSAVDVTQGINWAADNGAEVINLSLGAVGADSPILEDAVNRAAGKGIVVVAAAGNQDTSAPSYPAAYPEVISVSATDQNDRKAPFSNFGRTIDVAAPGVDIVTTAIGGYTSINGTSFSSPFTAGVAGLLVAQGRSADGVRSRLESTAEDIGPDGKDFYYGNGRIDAAAAVAAVSQTPPPEEPPEKNTAPKIKIKRPGPGSKIKDRRPTIRAIVEDAQTDLGKSDISLAFDGNETDEFAYSGGRDRLSHRPAGRLEPGRHTVKVVARDEQGRATTEKWSFRVKEPREASSPNGQSGPGFPFEVLPGGYPFGMFR